MRRLPKAIESKPIAQRIDQQVACDDDEIHHVLIRIVFRQEHGQAGELGEVSTCALRLELCQHIGI